MNHCNACHFHEPVGMGKNGRGEDTPVGTCMRYPPQITVSGQSSSPTVGSETSWCGEFRAKDNRPEKYQPKGSRR